MWHADKPNDLRPHYVGFTLDHTEAAKTAVNEALKTFPNSERATTTDNFSFTIETRSEAEQRKYLDEVSAFLKKRDLTGKAFYRHGNEGFDIPVLHPNQAED